MSLSNNIIYKVVNKVNGKIYIGKTTKFKRRKQQHITDAFNGCNYVFHKAIRKYGVEQFEWNIIWEGDNELLNEMEIYFIKLYNSYYSYEKGYNMTFGGDGNTGLRTDETKRKISECKRGIKHSADTKDKISKSCKGIKRSDETIEKYRIANIAEKNPNFNHKTYNFIHKDGTEEFCETVNYMNKTYNCNGFSKITTNARQSYRKWKINNN